MYVELFVGLMCVCTSRVLVTLNWGPLYMVTSRNVNFLVLYYMFVGEFDSRMYLVDII